MVLQNRKQTKVDAIAQLIEALHSISTGSIFPSLLVSSITSKDQEFQVSISNLMGNPIAKEVRVALNKVSAGDENQVLSGQQFQNSIAAEPTLFSWKPTDTNLLSKSGLLTFDLEIQYGESATSLSRSNFKRSYASMLAPKVSVKQLKISVSKAGEEEAINLTLDSPKLLKDAIPVLMADKRKLVLSFQLADADSLVNPQQVALQLYNSQAHREAIIPFKKD